MEVNPTPEARSIMLFTTNRWACSWVIAALMLAGVGNTPSRGQENAGLPEGIHVTINGGGSVTATMTITAGPGGVAATQPDGVGGTGSATQPDERVGMNVAGRTGWSATQPTIKSQGANPGDGTKPAAVAGLMENGPLQGVAEPMGKLIQLSCMGAGIQLDREHWSQVSPGPDPNPPGGVRRAAAAGVQIQFPVLQRVFQQLASAQRNQSMSSSYGGRNQMSSMFTGEKLAGKVEMDEDRVTIAVTEKIDTQRRLEVTDGGDGTLRIIVSNVNGDMVLLTQGSRGAVAVVWLVGGKTEAVAAENYLALYRAKRELMNQQVLPAFKHMGIDLLIWPDSPVVYQAAVSLLAPVGLEQEAAGKRLIRQLDSDEFNTREAATKELTDQYGRYRTLISAAIADATTSVEAADRLQKIQELHPEDKKARQLITGMGLLDDPVFLAGVLSNAGPEQRPAVVRRLEKVTGQKLGDNPARWKKWAENH